MPRKIPGHLSFEHATHIQLSHLEYPARRQSLVSGYPVDKHIIRILPAIEDKFIFAGCECLIIIKYFNKLSGYRDYLKLEFCILLWYNFEIHIMPEWIRINLKVYFNQRYS